MLAGCRQVPVAEKGTINLSSYNFSDQPKTNLKGDWLLIKDRFLSFSDLNNLDNPDIIVANYCKVPGLWNYLSKDKWIGKGVGYGTYVLKIILPHNRPPLWLEYSNAATAMQIFLNDSLVGNVGTPGNSKAGSVPGYCPGNNLLPANSDTVSLIIHVSNFAHKKGGLWEPVYIGNYKEISRGRNKVALMEFFLLGCIFILAIYHFFLFLLQRHTRYNFFFSIFCLFIGLRMTVTGAHMLHCLWPDYWLWLVRLEYISLYLATPAFGLFLYSFYPRDFNRRIMHCYALTGLVLGLFTSFTPSLWFTYIMLPYQIVTIVISIYAIWVLIRVSNKKRNGSIAILIGFSILFITLINDILYQNQVIHSTNLVSIGIVAFVFFLAFIISSRLSLLYKSLQKTKSELNFFNYCKELAIEARTLEVSMQRDKIEAQNQDYKSSLRYASRIQSAILPDMNMLQDVLAGSFVLFKPKEAVSGDFYWIREAEDVLFIAVADCTGHGIPAAFMSFLGFSLLNEVITDYTANKDYNNVIRPDVVLGYLRSRIKESLKQSLDYEELQDGMDISLCIIDKSTRLLQYAGANLPLILITHTVHNLESLSKDMRITIDPIDNTHKLILFRPDHMPLGSYIKEDPYTNHTVQLSSDDLIYLFTDGFEDQPGGERDKKFSRQQFIRKLEEVYEKTLDEQRDILWQTFSDWRKNFPEQVDDILVLGILIK